MPTASTRAVAITGLGAVTALGADVRALVTGLAEGRCAIGPLTLFAHAGRCRIAAEVPEAVPVPLAAVAPATARRLSRADRFAPAAAAEACRDAGLDAALRQRTAIAVGATTGGMRETEEAYRRRRAGADRRFRLGRMLGTPLSTSAAAVSQALGLFGPRVTFSTACSSSALAIAAATDAIRAGRTPLALAIGTDQLCRLTYAGFHALQALDPAPCRPFGERRRSCSRRPTTRAPAGRAFMPSCSGTVPQPTPTIRRRRTRRGREQWRPCARRSPTRACPPSASTTSTRTAAGRRRTTPSRSACCGRSSADGCRACR